MEIYQLLRRGEIHKDFCEDFLLAFDLNKQYSVFGVFDGCSTGVDSHMASALLAKVVKAELQCLIDEPTESLNKTLIDTVYNTMSTLRNLRNDLLLETNELLSTMILFLVDKLSNTGEILVFGDGFVSINGKAELIDQENTPDYMAYYLDKLVDIEDFEGWILEHSKRFEITDIKDVSISTDGITSFQKIKSIEANSNIEPKEFLINNDYLQKNKSMLSRKCNILKTKYGLVNQDDIGLIRVVV